MLTTALKTTALLSHRCASVLLLAQYLQPRGSDQEGKGKHMTACGNDVYDTTAKAHTRLCKTASAGSNTGQMVLFS